AERVHRAVVRARIGHVPRERDAPVERGQRARELFARRALLAVAENENVELDLAIDARAGFQEALRVLLRPQVPAETDDDAAFRDAELVTQRRTTVGGLEAIERHAVGNARDLLRR